MIPGNSCDAELWNASQRLYPDLPPIEAYLALHRDYVAPMVGPIVNEGLDVAECIIAWKFPSLHPMLLKTRFKAEKLCPRIYSYIKHHYGSSQSTTMNLPVNEQEISAQLTAEISKQFKTNTLGEPKPFVDGFDTAPAGTSAANESVKNIPKGTKNNNTSPASGSSGPGESFFDSINYLECWNTTLRTIQTAQAQQIIKSLNVIADNLGDSNCIAVMGAGGPEGFARPIYDLIKMKINKIDAGDRKNHQFFIYHDSNNWHQAFERLTRENPLPSEFINNPCDDLDHVCLFMREVRQKLLAKDEKRGRGIKFHLVIPSWSKLQISEPLHFPEDLYPLQIEGMKHNGKNQVELNLPAAPNGLLHGVSNVLDPNYWNKIAAGTSAAVTLPAVGWGVNGACFGIGFIVGSFTGAGLLVAIPFWVGSAPYCMSKSAPIIEDTIHDALREEDPRVLGSKERLKKL